MTRAQGLGREAGQAEDCHGPQHGTLDSATTATEANSEQPLSLRDKAVVLCCKHGCSSSKSGPEETGTWPSGAKPT